MKRLNILIAILSIGILSVYLPTTNATLTTNTEWMQEKNSKNNNKVDEITNLSQETTENTTTENTMETAKQNSSTETIKETFDRNSEKKETPSTELETPKTENNSIQKEETTNAETKEAETSNNDIENKEEKANNDIENKEENNTTNTIITQDTPIIKIPTIKNIILVDKSTGNYCAQAIEYFYEDNEYIYYFNCIKSNNMYVIINKEEYKLTDALKNKIVTMQELNEAGYSFNKIAKNIM